MSFGLSSTWFTRFRRCWGARRFDRGAWPAISSRPLSQLAGPSNGIRACAWCTTSASPRHGGDQWHSYSVPLIPDIALRVPGGPNAGLHLFDAKFRVKALAEVGLAADDKDTDDEKAAERGGFVQACRHLQDARLPRRNSGRPDRWWILYPGGQFRFFGFPGGGGPSGRRAGSSPEGLPEEFEGVGAIPVGPVVGGEGGHGPGMAGASDGVLRVTLRRMLPGRAAM